ncbi:MAG: hypothetical protein AAFS10_16790, partial [Myxococcota bacterium]
VKESIEREGFLYRYQVVLWEQTGNVDIRISALRKGNRCGDWADRSGSDNCGEMWVGFENSNGSLGATFLQETNLSPRQVINNRVYRIEYRPKPIFTSPTQRLVRNVGQSFTYEPTTQITLGGDVPNGGWSVSGIPGATITHINDHRARVTVPNTVALGDYTLRITATNREGRSEILDVPVTVTTDVPQITTTPVRMHDLADGNQYRYDADATSSASQEWSFVDTTPARPSSMHIDPNTGVVTWDNAEIGTWKVGIRVRSETGLEGIQEWWLVSKRTNRDAGGYQWNDSGAGITYAYNAYDLTLNNNRGRPESIYRDDLPSNETCPGDKICTADPRWETRTTSRVPIRERRCQKRCERRCHAFCSYTQDSCSPRGNRAWNDRSSCSGRSGCGRWDPRRCLECGWRNTGNCSDVTVGYTNVTNDTAHTDLTTNPSHDSLEGAVQIRLPFTFTYYDRDYDTIYACVNGPLTFDQNRCGSSESRFPSPDGQDDLFGLWDRFDARGGTNWDKARDRKILWRVLGGGNERVFIIQYSNVRVFSNGTNANFLYVLREHSGDIEIHIKDFSTSNDFYLGYENSDGTQGNAMRYCQASPTSHENNANDPHERDQDGNSCGESNLAGQAFLIDAPYEEPPNVLDPGLQVTYTVPDAEHPALDTTLSAVDNTMDTRVSALSCSQLNWRRPLWVTHIPGVCGESEPCRAPMNYDQAVAECASRGARLCTFNELNANAASNSGCDLNSRRVWTQSPCNTSSYWTQAGSSGSLGSRPLQCTQSIQRAYVRCCADTSTAPPPSDMTWTIVS